MSLGEKIHQSINKLKSRKLSIGIVVQFDLKTNIYKVRKFDHSYVWISKKERDFYRNEFLLLDEKVSET